MRFIKIFAKKLTLSLLLSIFLFFSFFSAGFFRPATVKAIPVEVLESVPQKTSDVWDQVQQALLSSALGSLVNAASYFTRKIAYDMAKGLADAAVGKKPAVFQQSPGDYLKDVALDTAASAIADLGVGALGINFCTPPDLNFQLNLQIGLSNIYSNEIGGGAEGPQPSCSWSKMKESWSDVKDKYSSTEIFNANLDVTQGGLGTTLVAKSNIDKLNAKSTASADAERAEGDGFKAIKDTISGKVKTPAQTVKSESEAVGAKQQGQMSASQIAGIYAVDAWQIIPTALSTFANTFVSTLANNILKDGLFPVSKDSGKESVTNPYASVLNYNRKAVENAYSYLITDIPVMNLSAYDYVTNFSICPDNPSIDNCVIDENWQNILNRSKTGETLTIQQAVDQGLLSPDLKFYSETSEENSLKECFRQGLCYSNLQKMRKARIIPLGFEILASKADPEKGSEITLGKALAGYYDINSPTYYGLINPNWILKAPEARIKLETYTENIIEGTDTRNKEVIDYDSLVKEDSAGKVYGYCLQEENFWNFYGDRCEEQFNTCKTFKNSSNGETNSYLSRTLEYGDCNLDSVGCSAYSLGKNFSLDIDNQTITFFDWMSSYTSLNIYDANSLKIGSNPRNFTIFLNANQEKNTCPAEADGCSTFSWEKKEYSYDPSTLETTSSTFSENINLKKAPDYLSCYDTNLFSSNIIEWPQTKADLLFLKTRSAECADYAQVCLPDEVGCSNYTAVNSGENIAGKVELENWCPSQCVGYETFRQNSSAFEESVFPLYFIPSSATQCSAGFAGCDEFTRLAQTGGGAESLVYFSDTKKCELPDGENAGVFYSWEGSADSGFVLRKHNLKKVGTAEEDFISGLSLSAQIKYEFEIGSPAYENDSSTALAEAYDVCKQEKYNKDLNGEFVENYDKSNCTALYDDEGNIFYRSLNKTITVSESCEKYRKTNSDLYKDVDISSESICLSKGGKWQAGDCLRCYDNGFYVAEGIAGENKGSCQYSTIKNEANVCPASANGCRLYVGNTGNNLYEVFRQDFEPKNDSASALTELKTNWCQDDPACNQNNLDIKPESTYVGGNSLRVMNTDVFYRLDSNVLFELDNQEKWFTLTFWAKGDNLNLEIYFESDDENTYFTRDVLTSQPNPVIINSEWREYKLGPILVNGNKNHPMNLYFDVNKNGTYFIDNVKLERVGDTGDDRVAVIKNSWKTNLGYDVEEVCDKEPLDIFPGRYLGCRSYTVNSDTNTSGSVINLTGFAKLCREEAIGCAKLQDTYNREDDYRDDYYAVYNLFCDRSVGCTYLVETDAGSPTATSSSGFIKGPLFFSQSYLNDISLETVQLKIVDSTYVIPPVSDPVYLTLRQDYLCDADYVGCTKMGKETQTKPDKALDSSYDFSEVFLINKPSVLADNLCTDNLVGCGAYTSNNLISYFKDPVLAGNTFCEYKTGLVDELGEPQDGWYKIGVGECQYSTIGSRKMSCMSDSQCPGESEKCLKIGMLPCGTLPSNGSGNYIGNVGICDSKNDGCTKLIDRADGDKNYFQIYNDKLTSQTASCEGKVSQEQGCVLLDREEYPNKLYNSSATYDASRTAKYNPVAPISNASNDSNLLVKVKIDRRCSTYLACDATSIETDSNGDKIEICTNYAVKGESLNLDRNFLDESKYKERIVTPGIPSWYDRDYVGYSFYNKRDLSNFRVIYLEDTAYLVYQDSLQSSESSCRGPEQIIAGVSVTPKLADYTTKCASGSGICLNGYCILPVDDSISFAGNSADSEEKLINILSGNTAKENLYRETCKTYPEATAPFDIRKINDCNGNLISDACSEKYSLPGLFILGSGYDRTEYFKIKTKYKGVNYCQIDENSEIGDCSCNYQKVEYKDGTVDFWYLDDKSLIAPGICSGLGDISGQPCIKDTDCGTGGICNRQSQIGDYRGLTGLCMEYDKGSKAEIIDEKKYYPCLTWYYSDRSVSRLDLNNFYLEAGYNPVNSADSDSDLGFGRVFCSTSTNDGYEVDQDKKDKHYYYDRHAVGTSQKPGFFGFYDSLNDRDRFLYNGKDKLNNPISFLYENLINENNDNEYAEYDWTPDDNGYSLPTLPVYSSFVEDQYALLTEWADKNIGPNSRIMRFDAVSHSTYWNKIAKTEHVAYSFAPAVGPQSGEYGDLGTLIHPPRFKKDNGRIEDILYNDYKNTFINTYGYYIDSNDEDDGISPINHKVYNSFLSPNFVSYSGNNKDKSFIYISDIENKIKEDEISKIHFVPIKHINGAEGKTLGLLDGETFTIDFNKLKNIDNNIYGYSVESYCLGYDKDWCKKDPKTGEYVYFTSYLFNSDFGEIKQYSSYNDNGIEKNKINNRYVGYFYTQEMVTGEPNNIQLKNICDGGVCEKPVENYDPFDLGKDATSKINEGNNRTLLAIGLDFNKEGDFLGYVSRFVDTHNNDEGENFGIRFAVIVELNDKCTDYTIGYVEDELLDNFIKPKTDILWSGKQGLDSNTQGYKNYINSPFGSLKTGDKFTLVKNGPFIDYYFAFIAETDSSKQGDAEGYPFNFSNQDIMYAYDLEVTGEDLFPTYSGFGGRSDSMSDYFVAYYQLNKENLGVEIETEEYKDGSSPKVFGVKRNSEEKRDVLGEVDTISINKTEQSNTTGTFTIIKKNQFKASLSFYAYADDNQMPIKKIILDYNDGSAPFISEGFFKNHKPYCSDSVGAFGRCTGTQVTCEKNSDCPSGSTCTKNTKENFFGDSNRACFEYPFVFTKEYVCNEDVAEPTNRELVSTITATHCFGKDGQNCGDLKDVLKNTLNNLEDSDYYCFYQPRVQITDNWGYCNGDCIGGLCSGGESGDCSVLQIESVSTKFNGYLVVLPENKE